MATRTLLKVVLAVLGIPFVVVSRIAEILNFWDIQRDIEVCLDVIDSSSTDLPQCFFDSLVVAEDRRNEMHHGVDPIAMIRAASIFVRFGQVQGASTIEQQFVRVVSGRYERSVKRKLREQVLAIAVSRRRTKRQIAVAYLSVAFYGYGRVGIPGVMSCSGPEVAALSERIVFGVIARLKYPEPSRPTVLWYVKFRRRVDYIQAHYPMATSTAVHPTPADAIADQRACTRG